MREKCPIPWRCTLNDGRQIGGLRWAGRGEPLILVHGLFDSAEGWREVCAGLDQPIIAFDLPGFARSEQVRQVALSSYADDLLQALRILKVKRGRLVGHSFGGAIASEMAWREGDIFSKLILLAPAGYGKLPLARFFDLPGVSGLSETIIRGSFSVSPLVEMVYRYAVVGGKKPQGDLVQRIRSLGPYVHSGVGDAIHTLALLERDYFPPSFYQGEVFCAWGDDDKIIPATHITHLQKTLPQASVEVWPGIAHHPQVEAREQVRLLLEEKPSKRSLWEKASLRKKSTTINR